MHPGLIYIENRIDYWNKQKTSFQSQCLHENVTKTHRSNTGNYDPSADCYWTEFICNDCDKRWSEDGSK
jgi:hypothetical protein